VNPTRTNPRTLHLPHAVNPSPLCPFLQGLNSIDFQNRIGLILSKTIKTNRFLSIFKTRVAVAQAAGMVGRARRVSVARIKPATRKGAATRGRLLCRSCACVSPLCARVVAALSDGSDGVLPKVDGSGRFRGPLPASFLRRHRRISAARYVSMQRWPCRRRNEKKGVRRLRRNRFLADRAVPLCLREGNDLETRARCPRF
jgi:hypothetical protein